MRLGAFSVSLAVKDIEASKQFYEKLGFAAFAGNQEKHWLIMRNGDNVIGLFQNMFDKNLMTFNPGWSQHCETLKEFNDIRELQRDFKAKGIEIATPIDESTKGPASFMVIDPDGNPILFDQHV